MKVVINACYGGFGVSALVIKELVMLNADCIQQTTPKQYYGGDNENFKHCENWEDQWAKDFVKYSDLGDGFKANPNNYNIYKDGILYDLKDRYGDSMTRADKNLIAVIEKLGIKANNRFSNLKIVEVPEDAKWHIEEYDGYEHVSEDHQTWS